TNRYNLFGDLVEQDYNDATPRVYFSDFNRAGQPREIVDASGTNRLIYDHISRLVGVTNIYGLLGGVAVSNHFHPYRGRDSLEVVGLSSPVKHTFGYDNYGRLNSITSGVYSA